ncbi:imelysin family protein, partial [Pantoea sp. SIMBA_072]
YIARRLEEHYPVLYTGENGLSAYEYILFDSKPDVATPEQKARYCPLLVAIADHQKALAEEILKGWNSTDGMLSQMTKFPNQRYADSHEA